MPPSREGAEGEDGVLLAWDGRSVAHGWVQALAVNAGPEGLQDDLADDFSGELLDADR